MFDKTTVAALMAGEHREPFAVLGLHPHEGAWVIRVLLPGAREVLVLEKPGQRRVATLHRVCTSDVFEALLTPHPERLTYQLEIDTTALTPTASTDASAAYQMLTGTGHGPGR